MSAGSAARGAFSTLSSNLFITLPIPRTNLKGQTYIVTGSNTGLGFEASRHINKLGAEKLIMAVRSISKGETARAEILRSTGREESSIEVWELDMGRHESIKNFAARVATTLPRIDGVLANAGIMVDKFKLVGDDESTLSINVVGTFLLFALLVPKLRESAERFNIAPRYTIPNSALHYMAPLKELENNMDIFTTLNDPQKADMAGRYPLSKLLVIYACRELAEKINADGKTSLTAIIINTPNPSYCKSALAQGTQAGRSTAGRVMEKLLARSTEEGSRALVHGVVSGVQTNGEYLTNCHVECPSSSVTSAKGVRIQKQFVGVLVDKLVRIAPEVSSYLK
ncbi:short-chain dehydrogenase, putative [Talaromyces stipitatus ATCC 10500]|uniref:Short-chain dehydrogenase, putative n=1 Tax=Talaromyces stipitatus (strain ATCC 10500 / CBS 375.48 / QM 6759 / NRRL 1006) TaxID=441959 RepID=B8MP57_TALSN|nr:short-chain dehydrogenase, putative [Talaromyces stipitatus ATCC 10500]EED14296.1 short-chain dehydrogenase, putative [Talaromyces stipitatus ATCC 10500]